MQFFTYLVSFIPFDKIYPISKFFGKILYFLLKKRTLIAYYNLNKILPQLEERKKKELIVNSYASLIGNILELIKIKNFNKEQIEDIFSIKGLDVLNSILLRGKGCILVNGHFGNWELPVVLPLFLNQTILTVGKKQRPEFFNNYLFNLRINFGMKVIQSKNSLMPIFKTLKKGGIVGFIMDQRTRKENSALIDFFGEKIYCTTAPAYLATKLDVPLLLCYAERGENGKHIFHFEKEIEICRKGDFEELLNKNTQKIHDEIKNLILKKPENWFWLHAKFKSKRKTLLEIRENK
jgi:KDO2-lipid IV(A) lauroyltransferase